MAPEITTAELKAAYQSAGLWRDGITYLHAINTPLIYRSLCNQVRVCRKHISENQPLQAAFELEAA